MSKHVWLSLLSNLEMKDLIQADKYHIKVDDFPLLLSPHLVSEVLVCPENFLSCTLDLETVKPKQSMFCFKI